MPGRWMTFAGNGATHVIVKDRGGIGDVIGRATIFPDAPIRIKIERNCTDPEAHILDAAGAVVCVYPRAGQLAAGDEIVIPLKVSLD